MKPKTGGVTALSLSHRLSRYPSHGNLLHNSWLNADVTV